MNYNQIAILFLQGTLVAFVILLLFRLRKRLGIGILFACLGLFQFVQVFLSSTFYVSITDNFIVSPGSSVFFTATIFALLIIYIKEDASETKKIIYALLIVNIVMSILLQTFGWHLEETSTYNPLNVSTDLFNVSAWVLFVGTIALFLDSLLIIIIFEFISRKVQFLFLQICLTMLIVVSFDTLFFSILAFWNFEKLDTIVISGLISKGVFAIFYSILFYFYLRYFDSKDSDLTIFKIKDVFQPLTYKQKFESAENYIKKTGEMYRILTDHSNDLICLQEPDSTFKHISPSIKKLLGYEESDFLGKQIFEVLHNDDVQRLKDAMKKKVFSSSIANNAFTCRVRHKEGHFVWFEFLTSPVYKEKKISYFVSSARDVTQRVVAKQKIETSIELLEKKDYSLKQTSKVAKIGYWEYDIITDTFMWSEYVYQVYGLDIKDKIPSRKEIVKLYDKESQKKLTQATLDLDSKGVPYDLELKLINKKNEEVWVRNVVQLKYNEQNEIVGRIGVVQNITDSKKLEFELELSKQEIQASLELLEKSEYSKNEASKIAKIGYLEDDIATETYVWSEYLYHIFGFDSKYPVPSRKEIASLFDKESQKKMEQATLNLDLKGIPFDLELKMINLRKENIWARIIVQPVYNRQNEIIGRRGVMQDITVSKNAQFVLDHQNEKLHNLNNILNQAQKLSHVGSWEWDMITDQAVWSDEMYNIYGVSKGIFYPSNENVTKTVLPEDLFKVEQGISSLLINKIFVPFEFRIKRPSGEIRNLYIMALEKKSEDSIFGVTKDITEIKQIEEEHLRVKDHYRKLYDNATISIWNEDFTLVFKQINELRKLKIPNIKIYLEQHPEVLFSLLEKVVVNSVNKATLKLFKAKSTQDFLNNIHNTFGEGAEEVFVNLIESIWNNEKIFRSEVNYKTLEGDEFAALFSIPIPETEVEQKTVPVSIQNIQSIKDAESEKRESINKLNEAQKIAHVGSWIFNLSSQKSEWSDETFRIWGFNSKKPAPDSETIINRIHIEDQELFNNAAALVCSQGTSYDIEFRICLPNNEQKTIRSICIPIFEDNGTVVSLKGTNQDITEHKRARRKIEEAEEMYRILTDNSNDLICLHELDSSFKYISPSIKNLLGYEPSELLGKNVFGIVHKDDIQSLKDVMKQRASNNMFIEAFSCRVLHKKGHFAWLEFLSSPVYEEKEISYFISSARDITQWVLAKQDIQEYQKSLQRLTTEITLIEEEQKKEIATNIHDHLSQSLVISKMKINELKKNPQLKVIHDDLKFIETHISEALENSRKITYELSPPVLYQLGIIDALNWLLDNVEATHKIECRINSNVDTIKLSDVKSILLYRSIQEVLNNAIKYANASLLTLDINSNKLGLNILVTDNGVGFDISVLNNYHNHSGSGFGLFVVEERIRNIQGEFTVTSEINKGTSVKIFIPLTA